MFSTHTSASTYVYFSCKNMPHKEEELKFKKTLTTSNLIRVVLTITESITPEGLCYA
jgi:hypothetical protein